MSTPVPPVEAGRLEADRRVRHQARDAAAVMGFSLAASLAAAVGLLLLTLFTAGR